MSLQHDGRIQYLPREFIFPSFSKFRRLLDAPTSQYSQASKAGVVQTPHHERGPSSQILKKGKVLRSSKPKKPDLQQATTLVVSHIIAPPHFPKKATTLLDKRIKDRVNILLEIYSLPSCEHQGDPMYCLRIIREVIRSSSAHHLEKSLTKGIMRRKYSFEKAGRYNHPELPTLFPRR